MLCYDGDGCDDETENYPRAIYIVTTVTFGKIIFRCEKICKFENQGYTESTPTVGTTNKMMFNGVWTAAPTSSL